LTTQKKKSSSRRIFSTTLADFFSIDIRSLALFRVGLGALLIADLINRSYDLIAHYTNKGALPTEVLSSHFPETQFITLHSLSGCLSLQVFLFASALLCAFGLMVGWRTRWMTFLSWVLLISLHSRNPLVLQRADTLLRLLLFWSMFIPLGAAYSIDRALDNSGKKIPEAIFSAGTAGLLLQIVFMYYFSVLHKWGEEWVNGSAIFYALSIDQFRTPLGDWLLARSELTRWLTHAVYVFEWVGPLLLFSPIFTSAARMIVAAGMCFMQVSFGSMMLLGIFPWVSCLAMVPFIPSGFWNWLTHRFNASERAKLKIYFDGDCGFCRRFSRILQTLLLLPEQSLHPAQESPSIYMDMQKKNSWVVVEPTSKRFYEFDAFRLLLKWSPIFFWIWPLLYLPPIPQIGKWFYKWTAHNRAAASLVTGFLKPRPLVLEPSPVATFLAALFIFYIFLWNRSTLDLPFVVPAPYDLIGWTIRIDQNWGMFAPSPLRKDGWFVMPGTFEDGREVDIFSKSTPVNWEKPKRISRMYSNARWRKYMMNLVDENYRGLIPYYARYVCRTWNKKGPAAPRLKDLQIIFMQEESGPNYTIKPIEKIVLWKGSCFDT